MTLDIAGGQCWKLYSDDTRNWDDANTKCKSDGAYLAEIRTEDENTALFDFVKANDLTEDIWIGLRDSKENQLDFLWQNSQENVRFDNWAQGEPMNRAESGDVNCVKTTQECS